MDELNIPDMRKTYNGKQDIFHFNDLVSKEPFGQFFSWLEAARNTKGIDNPNAVIVATATKDGKPSVRTVLMKSADKRGLVFCTNLHSKKAKDLAENPRASLLFYWSSNYGSTNSRQVRIEGLVEQVSEAESTEHFYSRPHASQIVACISKQSDVIQSRQILADKYTELAKTYSDGDAVIPKPSSWVGFRVVPSRFEFWQGHVDRLHDRIVFRKPEDGENINPDFTHTGTDGWVYERLMP